MLASDLLRLTLILFEVPLCATMTDFLEIVELDHATYCAFSFFSLVTLGPYQCLACSHHFFFSHFVSRSLLTNYIYIFLLWESVFVGHALCIRWISEAWTLFIVGPCSLCSKSGTLMTVFLLSTASNRVSQPAVGPQAGLICLKRHGLSGTKVWVRTVFCLLFRAHFC